MISTFQSIKTISRVENKICNATIKNKLQTFLNAKIKAN